MKDFFIANYTFICVNYEIIIYIYIFIFIFVYINIIVARIINQIEIITHYILLAI